MQDPKEKHNIICLSNQLWDFPLWTNKKQVMSRMAKLGHNVLFVDPPINTGFVFLRYFLNRSWPIKRMVTQRKKDLGVDIYSPLYSIPLYEWLSKYHVFRINNISKGIFDPDLKTILWVYHVEIPGLENYVQNLNYDFLVYDCVDNYTAFPQYDTKEKQEKIRLKEEFLTKSADVVFATAPGLVEKLSKINKETYFTPNVGDYDKFIDAKNFKDDLPDDVKDLKRPIIGFTGAVDEYKFDRELVKSVIEDYPNYSFVIIGPRGLKDRDATVESIGLGGKDNVHFLGIKPYEEIHKYYAAFDVFMIPYQLNDYTVGGCFPVKFHDAMAAGLPIVVTDLPAYAPFSEVCYISKTPNDFSQNIRRALEEDNDSKIKQRQKIAKDNSWDGKVQQMLNLIKDKINSQI